MNLRSRTIEDWTAFLDNIDQEGILEIRAIITNILSEHFSVNEMKSELCLSSHIVTSITINSLHRPTVAYELYRIATEEGRLGALIHAMIHHRAKGNAAQNSMIKSDNFMNFIEREDLAAALLDAFQTQNSLREMLHHRLGKSPNAVGPASKETERLSDTVFKLVDEAEDEGWKLDLIAAARESRPRNVALIAFSERHGLSALSTSPPELERIIRDTNAFLPINVWREKMGKVESAVCRVEVETNKGTVFGTGFLISPDILITNYHVVESAILGEEGKSTHDGLKAGGEDIGLRFDYKRTKSGSVLNPGTVYKLVKQGWLINHSPYAQNRHSPDPEELDYALLRVEGKPGCDSIGNTLEPEASNRGWIELSNVTHNFPSSPALVIVQHPRSTPLKIAIDTEAVIGVNEKGTMVKYRTNTEHGSSGSPCFNMNWELVALHHSGDPDFWNPKYNAGTPISAILALLEKRGLRSILKEQC